MTSEKLSVWILGDQLLPRHPALAKAAQTHPQEQIRVVLIESAARTQRLPYQCKKLVLLFSAMRHYAAALRGQGYTVDYLQAPTFLEGLRRQVTAWQPSSLYAMESSEWQARLFQ